MEVEQAHREEEPMNAEDQHGFNPLPEEKEAEKPRETPAVRILKEKINALICRYPELSLRSSAETMASLDQYDEKELTNIMANCINDLQKIRGVPAAEFAIHLLCGIIDWKLLPGYLERCQNDTELKRDVESEMMSWLGVMNTRLNIAFRLLNNAYLEWFQPNYEYYGSHLEEDEKKSQYMQDVGSQDKESEERPHKRARTSSGENKTSD